MSKKDEIIDILDLMIESIRLIQERFSRIQVPDDFCQTHIPKLSEVLQKMRRAAI